MPVAAVLRAKQFTKEPYVSAKDLYNDKTAPLSCKKSLYCGQCLPQLFCARSTSLLPHPHTYIYVGG